MSRTTLCVVTAAGLAALSIGLMVWRYYELGDETRGPLGPGAWKVTMVVRGKTHGSGRLITAAPLDFGHQHIFGEVYRSGEFKQKQQDNRHQDCCRHPERRVVLWSQRPGSGKVAFQTRYEFRCAVQWRQPSPTMNRLTKALYAPPRLGEHVASEAHIDPSARELSTLALRLVSGLDRPADQARELFRYVDREVGNEPSVNGPGISDIDCLKNGSGDAAAKSRLLAALCRNRGIPARLVSGLALGKEQKESAHVWVEAWVNGHWMPMCPYYHHLGRVPPTYLVFGFGDMMMARGHDLHDLDYGFHVEHLNKPDDAEEDNDFPRNLMLAYSLHNLPPTAHRLVEFLLLLPVAALIICVYRNLIGLESFGTFAPALIGLAFRDLRDSWRGIVVFVAIVLIGWGMRRILDRYHLLQVPRKAFVLSLVVILLISSIVAANSHGVEATRYITLFPMVILTGMIERFWTLEAEDGTSSSFKTLFTTMLIAASISLLLSLEVVVNHMFRYPETLGLVMAAQLLIGRYTGYRLSELYRFKDFVKANA
jgi:7 transmembrane helices usually fused to an inactive transglutaminase/Transglutaminase-like superfamily